MNSTSPTATGNATANATLHGTTSARLSALALASVLTAAMLLGVNSLARVDGSAAQMAQQTAQTRA